MYDFSRTALSEIVSTILADIESLSGAEDRVFKTQRKLFSIASALERDAPGFFRKRPFLKNELALTRVLLAMNELTELPGPFTEYLGDREDFIRPANNAERT